MINVHKRAGAILLTLAALAASPAGSAVATFGSVFTPAPLAPAATPEDTIRPLAEAVVLQTATLDAVTGAINWGKVACWTGVVGVAVGASLVGSPGLGAGASAAMAIACLSIY